MKLACLHFDLSGGPEEVNISKLCAGIELAAKRGASWVVTPEMAVQGYFFTQLGRPHTIYQQPGVQTAPFQRLAQEYGVTIFLGCAERDVVSGNDYNACLVIDKLGDVVGRHRKLRTVHSKTESWSSPGEHLMPVMIDGIKTGLLVCADAWFSEHSRRLGELGAETIVVVAAWPPGCGGPPEEAWMRASVASGGLPLVVCNQTGTTHGMDCTIAQSAIVVDGTLRDSYAGQEEAVLLVDLPVKGAVGISPAFEVVRFKG